MEGDEIEVRKVGRRTRQIVGMTILLEEESREALVHTDVLDPVLAQDLVERIGGFLIIHAPPSRDRSGRIELQAVDL